MTIKDVKESHYFHFFLSVISNKEEIIKAIELEIQKKEKSRKDVNTEEILHYSILLNALQYFQEMTDNEAYTIKKRIQAKSV